MHEHSTNGDTQDANLAWQALLYASGELDAAQTNIFEQRLGHDQAAREALCLAAPLVQVTGAGSRPNPAYREHVRNQLRRGSGLWQWLCGKRAYRGHPLAWGLGGAAAAISVMVWFGQSACPRKGDHGADLVAEPPAIVQAEAEPTHVVSSLEAASIWAEISPSDHLLKAHGEEARRKSRVEEWRRLMHSEGYRTRIPMNPCN